MIKRKTVEADEADEEEAPAESERRKAAATVASDPSELPSITVEVFAHGGELLKTALIMPPGFTHTLVNTVGKLGCNNLYAQPVGERNAAVDVKELCKKFNKNKLIYQGNATISESNKILESSKMDTFCEMFYKNPTSFRAITREFNNASIPRVLEYYSAHTTLGSVNQTRVLSHDKIFSIGMDDAYEKTYMGVRVVEIYRVRDPIIREIFGSLRTPPPGYLPLNICDYRTIRMIYRTLIFQKITLKKQLPLVPGFGDISDYLRRTRDWVYLPLGQKHGVGLSLEEVISLEDAGTDVDAFKVHEFTLSQLCRFLNILGSFRHCNILDISCRWPEEGEGCVSENPGECADYMDPESGAHQRLRAASFEEVKRGYEFFKAHPHLGGIKKNTRKFKKHKRSNKKNKMIDYKEYKKNLALCRGNKTRRKTRVSPKKYPRRSPFSR